jgi:hypothetical protein
MGGLPAGPDEPGWRQQYERHPWAGRSWLAAPYWPPSLQKMCVQSRASCGSRETMTAICEIQATYDLSGRVAKCRYGRPNPSPWLRLAHNGTRQSWSESSESERRHRPRDVCQILPPFRLGTKCSEAPRGRAGHRAALECQSGAVAARRATQANCWNLVSSKEPRVR